MQYFADKAEGFLAPKKLYSGMGDARLEYSAFGILLSIQPWNYPYYELARFVGPHLMSGNVILLKRRRSPRKSEMGRGGALYRVVDADR
jgi:succinate-semialdehyde dehydrogenase/glutarate-semialdehyde dehydrogenase